MVFETVEEKVSVSGNKIALVSNSAGNRFNIRIGDYVEDKGGDESEYLFLHMKIEEKARKAYDKLK